MRRIPIGPTLLVGVAVAIMIALGLWQLVDRRPKKLAFLAELAANPSRPPVRFPTRPSDALLFRRTAATCLPPVATTLAGAGASGFRAVATCANGVIVQLGTTRDPMARIAWNGGPVVGTLAHAPDSRPLLALAIDHRPAPMMIVADTPPPGLSRNVTPDPDAIPNNHLAYGVQWFFFAAVALVIYVAALRRRAVAPTRPGR